MTWEAKCARAAAKEKQETEKRLQKREEKVCPDVVILRESGAF